MSSESKSTTADTVLSSSTGSRPNIFIDVSQVSKLDTFGAWLIERLRRSLTQGGIEAKSAGLSANYSSLVDEVRRVKAAPASDTQSVTITGMLDQVGRSMVGISATIVGLIDMLGASACRAGDAGVPACWTVWATSCAISLAPDVDSGWKRPERK